ncbi:response regulator [Pseudoduganella albidiflava]|uniref:Response regulator n=1 Tax=Pseudoduganella albidiflava TaxID=321983 RepID=A0A411WWP3_9BURK|nr:response regulator [Pseudoduganella albidiflava]QBI01194.1 response regulator [Pseudoduganella albidiflava]GGY48852.1 hypothetical protein GCM10007387_33900 [Pseudoduganella albidiflava]
MKIIICDDDVVRRQRLVGFLSSIDKTSSFKVHEVSTTDEVSKLLSDQYFDALVLDVVVPKRSDDTPSAHNGSRLLNQICNGRKLRKPERIIALTAYLEDIQQYRSAFADFGVAVVEARTQQPDWENAVLDSLAYTAESQVARARLPLLNVISVHGIRTYGGWQHKLQALVTESAGHVEFHHHKYGYFSALSFLLPTSRDVEVNRLIAHLSGVFNKDREKKFIIFAHSFGTFLVANALEELYRQGYRNVHRIVLSGSVLRSNYDWRFLNGCGVEIINDCAQNDLVLWVSEAVVLKTGMAGKVGFYGIQNPSITNRFQLGGHSVYFYGLTFMREFWIPLLDPSVPVAQFDKRNEPGVIHHFVEGIISFIGKIKPYLYASGVLWVLYRMGLFSLAK